MMTMKFKIGNKVRLKDDNIKKKYFPDTYLVINIGTYDLIILSDINEKRVTQLYAWRLEHLLRPSLQDDPEYKDLFI